jgi:hypothetical protein
MMQQPDQPDAAEAARRAVAEEWLQRLGVMLGARSSGMHDPEAAQRAQVAEATRRDEQARQAAEERRRVFDAYLAARQAAEGEDAA